MTAPQTFGKYQLLKKLATGGMAEVWLARSTGIEGFTKNVVVKRILPHLAEDREFVEMFRNEALIAANFNHPNIAQVYEFGEANGTYFIAMEYIHGEDLGRVMRKAWTAGQWIARPLAIRIVASACEGLYYAHTRVDGSGKPLKVVHRDISPQNILISFDGSVKLVDFGIAKAADTVGLTKSGAIKGKFAYMAPEQAGGKALDHRADIFAIGLVLYELLTGVRPLKRDSELATLQAALECAITTPSEVADVPSELDSVVMNALSKAADDRYRDARQFQIALEETLVAQRWVASSVQISELMETLFADRLAEEKKTGNLMPTTTEEFSSQSNSSPASPQEPVQGRRGAPPAPKVDMEWEAPPGEVSQRNERRATSAQMRAAERPRDPNSPRSLAEEMAEYAAPSGGTAVARRRTGELPKRTGGETAIARTPSRPDMARAEFEAPPPEPPPQRRSSARQLQVEQEEDEDELPSRTRARARTGALAAINARARYDEDPDADPERTRLPPPSREPEPSPDETLPPPAPPRRRTGQVSRVQPAVDPHEAPTAPRRRTSSRVELRQAPPPPKRPEPEEEDEAPSRPQAAAKAPRRSINTADLLKKIVLLVAAVAMAGGLVMFWPKLMKRPIDGMGIFVTVDTNPKVNVRVLHSDKCGSPEPVTDLGMTPLKGVSGAHIQDTLVLENKAQGIYAEEKDLLSFGEPGETKSIKREFRLGNLLLKVTPKNVGDLSISREGQDLGKTISGGAKLELMEGTHRLELRGDRLKEPVEIEVNVKARDTTTEMIDVSKHM
ncbi:serine/threonine-protein kinase [Hyalangium minutum]|uniref:Serine/threonine protein kinase PrkC, regulator of stationary phase n=1 Tax=Hyalangium minutum TaxID=394096 RepID=A0A085W638_9BACT|nr:serine/threonine-protein kinase [Hyalangium minutum]KFE63151.1 Serine/threonine protein kinase PrkC, regulator of stationary phase [Hyalangium minutum]